MAGLSPMDGAEPEPAWLVSELPRGLRWSMMLRMAWRMALHDRQQTIAAVLGVAFAYVLVGQNFGSAGHYLDQATAYIDASEADLWIVPPGEKAFFATGSLLSTGALHQASVTPGVAWATPVVRGYSAIKTPNGGAENVIVIGVPAPALHGGPFSIIKGDSSALLKPNAIFVDDAEREKLGGLNLGSTVELGGHRAHVEGLTWGLLTILGSVVFAEYDFARSILEIDSDRLSIVMVRLDGSAGLLRVRDELRTRVPEAAILTTDEYWMLTRNFILYDAGLIGVIFMGLTIGLTVGLAIVALSMLSSVQQNLREFGTLKAIGATSADLRRLLIFQALGCSIAGSFIGAVVLCQLSWASRSPRLNMIIHPLTLWGLVPGVTIIAITAALVAVRRTSRVEPASVFR
ncbi:MAG TPA: ABC transporter permease [Labilithrix sp.]|nr:ABC transporter permease [Labilithrix sp.]